MIIKVEAIIREEKFEDVKAALNDIEVNGITVSQVMALGPREDSKKWSAVLKWRSSCIEDQV